MLSKSEEKAMGYCAKAKLSAKWLHLTLMAMAESCSATGVSLEELLKTSPSQAQSSYSNRSSHPSHMSQGEGRSVNPAEEPCSLHGKPVKWKQIRREVGDITLGFWDLWYHFRTEDIRAPGCQVIPTRVHRSALVGIRDQLCLWAGSLSGARHLSTPPGDP